MYIGHIIRALRAEKGITQEQLALEADLATSNVSRIENGLRQPSHRALERLARALGCSVGDLYRMGEGLEQVATHQANTSSPGHLVSGSGEVLSLFHALEPNNRLLAKEHMRMLLRLQKQAAGAE